MKPNGILLLELQLATLVTGLQAKLAANGTYTVAGVTLTRDELLKKTEELSELFAGAREAWAAARRKAHERDRRVPEVRKYLLEMRSLLNTQFGAESEELLAFGFQPRKRPNRSKPEAAKPEAAKPEAAKPEERKPAA